MKKNLGFTLSEVMIVVAIIGVIAALTIPNVVTKFQKEAQITQIRKIAQELEQVVDNVTTAEGKSSFQYTNAFTEKNPVILLNELSYTDFDCGSNGENCFAPSYKSINGSSATFSCSGGSTKQLESSASICIIYHDEQTSSLGGFASIKLAGKAGISGSLVPPDGGIGGAEAEVNLGGKIEPLTKYEPAYFEVYIDTNGPKGGPNTGGRDMFQIFIHSDGLVYGEKPTDGKVTALPMAANYNSCKSSPLGKNCYKFLETDNWEMKY